MALAGLVRVSGKTLLTTVAITGVGFFSSVITARILGPEGRGLLSAALLIATIAAGVSQLGLANSFIYFRGGGQRFNYWALLGVSLVLVCTLSVVFSVLGLRVSADERLWNQLILVGCLTGFMAAEVYFLSLSQLHPGLFFFNMMRFGLVFGNLAALLLLLAVFDEIDYRKILLTQLLVLAVLSTAGLLWVRKALPAHHVPFTNRVARWREIFSFGTSYHGTVFLGIVLMNFDKIVLLRMGTMVQFGFYALAFTTSRFIGALQAAVSTTLYARFAGRDVDELSAGVRTAFRVTFLPMLIVGALGAIFSPWLVVLMFGEDFASMAAPFSILLLECVVGSASWVLAQRFNAGGRPGMVFARQLISVLPIFMALPFLPKENLVLYLSGLMLLGAMLRLGVTLCLYPLVLKEAIPGLIPTLGDFRALRLLLAGGRTA